jgi:hypothetical protein
MGKQLDDQNIVTTLRGAAISDRVQHHQTVRQFSTGAGCASCPPLSVR